LANCGSTEKPNSSVGNFMGLAVNDGSFGTQYNVSSALRRRYMLFY
jgi:hypothetical protein